MNVAQLGLVSSLFTLGGLIGALAAGTFSARYGRLRTMLGTSIFHVLGPVFEALAPNIATLAFGRVLSGCGAGAALVVVPIYIAEIAPPKERGFFGAFTQVTTNVGILTTEVLGLFLSKPRSWRIILAAGGGFGLLQVVGLLLFGQESPKWLADHGRANEAQTILRKISGHGADIDPEVRAWTASDASLSRNEVSALLNNQDDDTDPETRPVAGNQTTAQNLSHKPIGFFGILRNAETRFAIFVVMVVMLGQQLTGINSVVMYGVDVLSELLAANSTLLNVGVAALNVIVPAGAAPLTDRLGRRTCLLMSVAVMGISSLFIGVGIAKHIPVMSGTAVVTFVAGFALGLGPIPFILSSELVNADAVSATQSWALAANWISTFLVAQFFPIINEKLGGGRTYYIFTAVAVVFGIFVATYLPETKGLATADEVWGRKKPASERED